MIQYNDRPCWAEYGNYCGGGGDYSYDVLSRGRGEVRGRVILMDAPEIARVLLFTPGFLSTTPSLPDWVIEEFLLDTEPWAACGMGYRKWTVVESGKAWATGEWTFADEDEQAHPGSGDICVVAPGYAAVKFENLPSVDGDLLLADIALPIDSASWWVFYPAASGITGTARQPGSPTATPAPTPAPTRTPTPTPVPNPGVTILLWGLGITRSHDQLALLYPEDDVRLLVTVLNGSKLLTKVFPAEGQPTYQVAVENSLSLRQVVFETAEVADVLQVSIMAVEEDDASWIGAVLPVAQAMGVADLGASFVVANVAASLLEGMLGDNESIGSYQARWTRADGWGAGRYEDVGEGDIRLWFDVKVR